MRTRQLSVIFWVLLMVLQVSCAKKDQIIGDGRLIRHIRFEGADSLSKDLLLKHLFAGETSWVPFTPRYVYDEALTSVDTKRLVELYKSYGFFDASVISLEVLEPTKKKVDLVFKVHEGPRATVRSLHFEWIVDGESDFDSEHRKRIEKHSALSPQGPWATVFLGETVGNIRQKLLQEGHPLAEVTGTAELDEDAFFADVHVVIKPGPYATIGNIVFEGLVKVREKDIKPDVRFAIGKPYSPALVLQVEQALQAARVFRWVLARPVTKVENGQADLVVRLDEADPQSLRLGAQVTMENIRWQQHLRADYGHTNLFGNLTRFDLKMIGGYAELPVPWRLKEHGPVVEVSPSLSKKGFLEPHLLWDWSPSFFLDLAEGYQYWSIHNRMGVSRWFFGRLLLGTSYNLRFFDFFSVSPSLDNEDTPLGLDYRDPYLLSYMEFKAILYLTDSITAPSNGVTLEFIYHIAGLGGHFSYNKFIGTLTGYLQPIKWLSMAARFSVGSIITFGKNAAAPISEHLYLGGGYSMRGFGSRRLGPRILDCETDGECKVIPTGGFTSIQSNIEFRFNIWGPIFLVTFLDIGDVQSKERTFKPKEWNYAAGPGIRYDSSLGLIRLDAGFRLNDPGIYDEPRWAIHFGWGQTF